MSDMTSDTVVEHHDAHDIPVGWRRWLFATNHKDIGTLYLLLSITNLMIGGVMALMIRAELFEPGLQIMRPEFFNQLSTEHGLVMIFGAVMPAFVGLANWMIPLQIGASDMAFARMNNLSFWLLPVSSVLLIGSFWVPGGAPAAGWTMYAPLSTQMGPGMDLSIFAIHLAGASSIMGAINIIVTILNMRAPGMTLMKMPMFAWTWLITAFLLIAIMPVLAGAVTMLLFDPALRHVVFQRGGRRRSGPVPAHFLVLRSPRGLRHDPAGLRDGVSSDSGVLPQAVVRLCLDGVCHIIHRHSLLHGLGASHVRDRHARDRPTVLHVRNHDHRRADGREGVQLDRNDVARFAQLRNAHALCDGVYLCVCRRGLTGVTLAMAPLNVALHGTYYIIAHFHYVMVAGSLFSIFAGWYYWVPKWTGYMYNELRGKIHFWGSMIFFNVTFFPMHFLGLAGMPRRYATTPRSSRTSTRSRRSVHSVSVFCRSTSCSG